MPESSALNLATPDATTAAGRALGRAIAGQRPDSLVVYLRGTLGAGKTTLARGVLAGFGHDGRVPSPTYTLIEPYAPAGRQVYHIDLYRLSGPGEAIELDLPGLLGAGVVLLVEWPERGEGHIPAPDLDVALSVAGKGRRLEIRAGSDAGRAILGARQWAEPPIL